MNGKQYRPWSDAMFCGVWSGSTLFAQAYLSEYLNTVYICISDYAFNDFLLLALVKINLELMD